MCSCSEPYLGIKIPFIATWQGDAIRCGDGEVALSDLRFFVSEVRLVATDGRTQALKLHADIPWQQPGVALIDLEDGQGACSNGTSEQFAYLVGSAPPGNYTTLRFTVGVPFEQNHANPLTADAPLDDPAMHWHWRSGYKFIRAGVATTDDSFWIHVGSSGCAGTVRNVTGCRSPNRVAVTLDEFVPNQSVVAIDLGAFFDGNDFSDGNPTDCSSGPAETQCVAPFAALGIDFESGAASGSQRVFSTLQ